MNKSKGHRVAEGKQKINCKDCINKCCDNAKIKKCGRKGQNLDKLKTGSRVFINGITWVKKANGLWKCIAYDCKTKLCKIYPYRPPVCRTFFCKYANRKKVKKISYIPPEDIDNPLYKLIFNFSFDFKE